MPYCAILECHNNSTIKTLKNGGVSYFKFPKDLHTKEQWIEATGRIGWMPTKNSTICSEHFKEENFLLSQKGYKCIKDHAIPTQKILKFFNELQGCRLKRKVESLTSFDCTNFSQPKKKFQTENEAPSFDALTNSDYCELSQSKKEYESRISKHEQSLHLKIATLEGRLRFCEEKIKSQNMKIKRLQRQNQRLKKKANSIEEVLKSLEENFKMSKENLDCLKNTNLQVQELVAREAENSASGVISRKQYSPALRSFALTLHYYSPKAYDYVRNTFKAGLPHPRTLKSWMAKIGGEPGFTKEALIALKMKADDTKGPLLATLVMDEMSIRRRVEWDGNKFHGYVDMGTDIEGDHLAEAKEALVFLVTAINSNFKVPVGFFLVDGVTGQQRADLVKVCLELIHNAGVRIVALTFDGCASNIAMAKHLGCSFEQGNIQFEHPVTKDSVVAILDPCHMIKLLRNTFEMYRTLIDKDGNKIQWQHLVELNKLQNNETFHLSNKLRDRHINFEKERMKVKLATQLFSESVANAIKFCRQTGLSAFTDSEPTEFFLIICNNLFDVFNSKNLHMYGYKKAVNVKNATQIFEFLCTAADYLQNLKTENGILLINSRRKTGFLGFLGCIKALEHLYSSLIETKILIYLPFYKFSQDHLELLFCNIRAQGGSNNNPTARQFISAYKKILTHVQLKDTNKGNCVALEQISILNCSSAVERINTSSFTSSKSLNATDQIEEEIEARVSDFSEFSNQAIGHIAGYVVRNLIKKVKCDVCVGALVTHHFEPFHMFIIAKDHGGLLYPSPDVMKICQTAESYLKIVDIGVFRKDVAMAQMMRNFIGTSLFNDIAFHQIGDFPASNHVTDLMKAIIEKYINVRIHHLLKLKIRLSKRQFLNKYVIFQGQ